MVIYFIALSSQQSAFSFQLPIQHLAVSSQPSAFSSQFWGVLDRSSSGANGHSPPFAPENVGIRRGEWHSPAFAPTGLSALKL
ncbi:MAG: hypothetical protein F6J93_29495 [Oscillatoria sp. SIO1A7]|nr:hypothetical protein [Oscillatoria sp. SIO1A7]